MSTFQLRNVGLFFKKYMIISKKRFLIMSLALILTLSWFFVTFQSVNAQQVGLSEVGEVYGSTDASTSTDIRTIAVRIINVTMQLLSVIIIVLMLYSGYQWMMAAGNEKQVTEAQARLKNAVIGLVLVLVSWGVSTFIFTYLIKATQ
jgi:hypothetical protein